MAQSTIETGTILDHEIGGLSQPFANANAIPDGIQDELETLTISSSDPDDAFTLPASFSGFTLVDNGDGTGTLTRPSPNGVPDTPIFTVSGLGTNSLTITDVADTGLPPVSVTDIPFTAQTNDLVDALIRAVQFSTTDTSPGDRQITFTIGDEETAPAATEIIATLSVVPQPIVVTTLDDVVDDTDGLTSLREAVTLANSDADASAITFATGPGTITLGGTELVLTTDLSIDGDVDGDGAADITISGNNASRVFRIDSGAAELSNLSIGGGNDSAIVVESELTLTSSTVAGNTALDGGAIFNNGVLYVTDSEVFGNYALSDGGAIFNSGNGRATIAGSYISDNYAADYGGGIQNYGILTITGSTLGLNSADVGGGLSSFIGAAYILNSAFADNTARAGGGIYSRFGTLDVSNSTFDSNEAQEGGGGIRNYSDVEISNSTFSGNTAAAGGGIHHDDGTLTATKRVRLDRRE
ncbi:MAG: right-handed parallel beta-helix repeat-containing protein [Pseudomonadota bacterium]